MPLLFDRKIRVTFGQPGELSTRVSDLYIQFNMEKNLEKSPNKGTVSITNLNQTSRALLQQKGVSALLEAGYKDSLDRLFVGQVKHSSTTRQGPNLVTQLEFHDGLEQFQESVANKSFSAGVSFQTVLEYLATELKVGIGVIKGLVTGEYQQGVSLFGPVSDRLTELMDKMGLEWSIQDNNLQILPPNTPSEILGILLTPDTGLIGSPIEREDSKKGGKFLEFKSLLMVELKPGAAVTIRSKEVAGVFKIRKVKYQGDNRTGPFECQCEGVEVEAGLITVPDRLSISTANVIPVVA